MFSTLSNTEILILPAFNLLSANAFNLAQPIKLSFGKGLKITWIEDYLNWILHKRYLIHSIVGYSGLSAAAASRLLLATFVWSSNDLSSIHSNSAIFSISVSPPKSNSTWKGDNSVLSKELARVLGLEFSLFVWLSEEYSTDTLFFKTS